MPKKTLTRLVLEILDSYPGSSLRDISQLTGIDIVRVREAVERLRLYGMLSKVGQGYVLTEKGKEYLKNLVSTEESQVKPVETPREREIEETSNEPASPPRPDDGGEKPLSMLSMRLEELEKKLAGLEKKVSEIENALRQLEDALSRSQTVRQSTQIVTEDVVVPVGDAVRKYGSMIDKWLREGRYIQVGSLMVEASFYESFKSKFPLKISEYSALSPVEKTLLEEMRKEGLVIVHAGKEYRLVE